MSAGVVNLSKGGVVNLSKQAPGLDQVMVGLGWDPAPQEVEASGPLSKLFGKKTPKVIKVADNIDCDATAILLRGSKLVNSGDVIYYAHKRHDSRTVEHQGDNITGEGDGDDEQIMIDLSKLPDDYNEVVLMVNIYKGIQKGQHFGMLQNAFIRLVNMRNGSEICHYNLSDSPEYINATAVIFGKLIRGNNGWEFVALGTPSRVHGIADVANTFK